APERDLKTVNFSFNHDERELSVVYKFADLEKEYPDKTVSFQGQAEIQDRERVAIVGENGCGKTTLLRILSQQDRQYRGKLKVHPNARIKYFEQNQAESLDPHNTVIEELRHYAPPDLSDNRLRTLLGCFLFHGDDVYKQVSILSGGEKARLALAQMVCSTSNVLLLDEPTNHLDFESREVLAEALNGYQGTILVVSHDRYFINQVCSRVMEMEDGVLKNYPGSYDYYKNKKEEEKKEANLQPNEQKSSRVYLKPSRNVKAGQSVNKKELLEKSFLMEAEISRKEARLNELETDMEKPENMGEPEKLQELVDEYSNLQKEIETKMENWAELAQLLEDMD
ncbi:MAG: ATP-binding cassette domain-containing protein, partial [Vulcanimicrobiota bacterium]